MLKTTFMFMQLITERILVTENISIIESTTTHTKSTHIKSIPTTENTHIKSTSSTKSTYAKNTSTIKSLHSKSTAITESTFTTIHIKSIKYY